MRISTSENFYHGYGCVLNDCERVYCAAHRWLFRMCESVPERNERGTYYGGECPKCRDDYEARQIIRLAIKRGDHVGEDYLARYGFKKGAA